MRRQLTLLDDGTAVDAVVGYRSWIVGARNGCVTLSSVTRGNVKWCPGQTMRSTCMCHHRKWWSEGMPHTCGLYAWNTPIILCHYPLIAGEVLLWGAVHVHELGYRGEFARISAFHVTDGLMSGMRRMMELAALQWDVPVVVLDHASSSVGSAT